MFVACCCFEDYLQEETGGEFIQFDASSIVFVDRIHGFEYLHLLYRQCSPMFI